MKSVHTIVAGDLAEAELRMSPPSTRADTPIAGDPGRTPLSHFSSPSKAIVNFGQGWPDSEDDEVQDQLAGGRQGSEL